eukprot:8521550-Alexandrium_andersonii.AAC.1
MSASSASSTTASKVCVLCRSGTVGWREYSHTYLQQNIHDEASEVFAPFKVRTLTGFNDNHGHRRVLRREHTHNMQTQTEGH